MFIYAIFHMQRLRLVRWTIRYYMISWKVLRFNELSTNQLFELLKLRVDVFVVEQECAYPELDEKDRHRETRHLLGYIDNQMVAYARLLPSGLSYPSVSIGRVATHKNIRGQGVGTLLLEQAINTCEGIWENQDIEIGAQEYLVSFYRRFKFVPTSPMYLEDGIPHIDMKRESSKRR